ncbi:MAG: pyridoxamine 5'-phosphate oxidase family protein [Spirochaetaceae bacterium]|nr:MAG: pyridoxamine 5'-phosphate oxidase family protein [Spirochaetaceae bacterium]
METDTTRELSTVVKQLMARQLYGVLATQGDAGTPHTSIVAFVSADDLNSVVFVTPRKTRKYRFLTERPSVALFVDNRRERADELMQVIGIEVTGTARELAGTHRNRYRAIFLAKYPEMAEFADAEDSSFIHVAVSRYDVVDHFQHVMVLPVPQNRDGTGGIA